MSQREVTTAKIRYIINNSGADCPILLKFTADHNDVTVTPDVPQTFRVQGSKVKVTA